MRNKGFGLKARDVDMLTKETLESYNFLEDTAFGIERQVKVLNYLYTQISEIEEHIKKRIKATTINNKYYRALNKVPGIGNILSMTILLETGEIERFKTAQNYASYCRMVNSIRESNGKKKGENNRKNGNRYLSWAYMEAAIFAIRSYPKVQKYYQRKMSKTNRILALKTVAHKISCGCYFVLRDGVSFDMNKLF